MLRISLPFRGVGNDIGYEHGLRPMSASGQTRKSTLVTAMSAFPPIATKLRTSREVRFVPILLQKSQKARRLICRQRTKQATIADQWGFKRATRIVCEFGAWRRGPHIIIQSLHLRVR